MVLVRGQHTEKGDRAISEQQPKGGAKASVVEGQLGKQVKTKKAKAPCLPCPDLPWNLRLCRASGNLVLGRHVLEAGLGD